MRGKNAVKLHYALIATALLAMLSFSCQKASGDINDFMNVNSNINCISPQVILENGANQTSTIYSNNTSAKISINANSTSLDYNYSLNIVNKVASLWEVRLEYYEYVNITRANATIILHNNSTSSEQITISGGNISQTNNYYNLASNATIHIGVVNLVENSSVGKTILYVYLRIKNPSTTTYSLYIITFEFT
jgi:hypothetical protein